MSCLIGVPYQVPPIGLLVLGHRLPVHQNGNPNHSNKEVVYIGELIVCFCFKIVKCFLHQQHVRVILN